MKTLHFGTAVLYGMCAVAISVSCNNTCKASNNPQECAFANAEPGAAVADTAVVYYIKEITPESLIRIYEALGVNPSGKVAVKISTGEAGGHNYLKPELIGGLVQKLDGTIVECNTAYPGKRTSTKKHLKVIEDHGFTSIAPVDIMDAKSSIDIPVVDKKWINFDRVGANVAKYDFMVDLAHFKGHAMGGYGGVLKNLSIGVASRSGKAYIHSAAIGETFSGRYSHAIGARLSNCLSDKVL